MADAESTYRHDPRLRAADGTWQHTNALARESSPYLLQHAHNPVQWRPWGTEAFELARRSAKPIFLSVGYSTCYWCHVMERQVFENPAIAALLNEHFVNIKVDREERPDVDDIYMVAVQMMTRHGGWPMSLFLTPPGAAGPADPGLKPFFAGTYFPPAPQQGMPGFPQVLGGLARVWREQRSEVLDQAERAAEAVREHLGGRDECGPVDPAMVEAVADQLLQSFDRTHGGFGAAPKFPQPSNLLFLLGVHRARPDPALWAALAHTLDHMARGGICDQVGGGFHRYSTDERWLVPHFEKMLYDNAQLVEVYCIAHEIRRPESDPHCHVRVVRATCDWVLREMTDATGMFWSAQDAEVEAREGANYLWTEPEAAAAIGDTALAALAGRMYGLAEGPNFKDPHHADAPWVNVLHVPRSWPELAGAEGLMLADLLARKASIDQRLRAARDRRPRPATDDKVLTGWNGLMIAALARAGRTLGEPRYTKAAASAAAYVLEHMRPADGGLYRTMRHGSPRIAAPLEDYALFVHGLLELHLADPRPRWLQAAAELTACAVFRFDAEDGGYYDTLADQSDLFVRKRGTYDGAISSASSQMVHNLLDLYERTGDRVHLDRAVRDLRSFATAMRQSGLGMVHMHHALLRALALAPARMALGAAATPGAEPVRVRVEPAVVDLADGPASAEVRVEIGTPYHLNSHEPGVEGLVPTSLQLHGGEGLVLDVRYPPGVPRDDLGDRPVRVYEGEVRLAVSIRRDGRRPAGEPRLMLTCQACTGRECLVPRTLEVPLEIRFDRELSAGRVGP